MASLGMVDAPRKRRDPIVVGSAEADPAAAMKQAASSKVRPDIARSPGMLRAQQSRSALQAVTSAVSPRRGFAKA
jgi:hypothetical protein